MRTKTLLLSRGAALGAAMLMAGSALAGNPLAAEKIALAKASVERAEQSGAPTYAPVDLESARNKVSRAEKLNADRDTKGAAMLADQADIDARVAEAVALQYRANKAAVEFDQAMLTLRQEAAHSSPTTH